MEKNVQALQKFQNKTTISYRKKKKERTLNLLIIFQFVRFSPSILSVCWDNSTIHSDFDSSRYLVKPVLCDLIEDIDKNIENKKMKDRALVQITIEVPLV